MTLTPGAAHAWALSPFQHDSSCVWSSQGSSWAWRRRQMHLPQLDVVELRVGVDVRVGDADEPPAGWPSSAGTRGSSASSTAISATLSCRDNAAQGSSGLRHPSQFTGRRRKFSTLSAPHCRVATGQLGRRSGFRLSYGVRESAALQDIRTYCSHQRGIRDAKQLLLRSGARGVKAMRLKQPVERRLLLLRGNAVRQ